MADLHIAVHAIYIFFCLFIYPSSPAGIVPPSAASCQPISKRTQHKAVCLLYLTMKIMSIYAAYTPVSSEIKSGSRSSVAHHRPRRRRWRCVSWPRCCWPRRCSFPSLTAGPPRWWGCGRLSVPRRPRLWHAPRFSAIPPAGEGRDTGSVTCERDV